MIIERSVEIEFLVSKTHVQVIMPFLSFLLLFIPFIGPILTLRLQVRVSENRVNVGSLFRCSWNRPAHSVVSSYIETST